MLGHSTFYLMDCDFQRIYAELCQSGVEPLLTQVKSLTTYKLVTGVDEFDPYRGASPGRAFGPDIFHIYTTDSTQVCSGEVLGTSPVPQNAIIGEYLISGEFLDYDRITVSGFQESWRAYSGERRHDFSQRFTDFLLLHDYIPSRVIGATWTSVSGKLLDISGRVYGVTVTGEQHVIYQRSHSYSG